MMGGKALVGVDSVEMIEDRKGIIMFLYNILKVYKNRTQYKTR